MTLLNPKFPRKCYAKNPRQCPRCKHLFEADPRGGTRKYCKPCKAIVKAEYEKKRYQNQKRKKYCLEYQQSKRDGENKLCSVNI